MAKRRGWHWDWAGSHGTVWGTANAIAAPVSASGLLHEVMRYEGGSRLLMAAIPFVAMIVGDAFILGRSATGQRQPRATVAYKLVCFTFAGLWCTCAVAHVPWGWKWWTASVAVLVGGGILFGLIASLGIEPAANPATPAAGPRTDLGQRQLNALRDEWEDRIARITTTTAVIDGIEHWPSGGGYTVEGEVGGGGATWRTVEAMQEQLAGDLKMEDGCRMDVRNIGNRRRFQIFVMTKDLLAPDYEYPPDRAVHSINDDLEVAVADDGADVGPCLRQNSVAIGGEAGSGKSNAKHCYTAEIVTTDDALEWDWDSTGKSWSAWMNKWLLGQVAMPPLDWCAQTPEEMRFMFRAAHRVATGRPVVYRQLMLQVDDDKVPISHTLPAIMVSGDEVAVITGSPPRFPDLQELVRLLAFEGRVAGVRPLFFPLRGTDDVFVSAIQSQCQVLGVMKVQSKAEAGWMLGNSGDGFGPEDTPYPGCGGLKFGSGMKTVKVKYRRMRPSTIERIVDMVQTRRPVLDHPSRMLANGRNPDGTPMANLMPGELDCYDTRWDRFVEQFGYDNTTPVQPAPRTVTVTVPAAADGPAMSSMAEELAKLQKTTAELEAAVALAQAANAEPDVDDLTADELEAFNAQMIADGFGPDWVDGGVQETPAKTTDLEVLLDIIREKGADGMKPVFMLPALAAAGIVISRDTLYVRLKELQDGNLIYSPRHGKWAAR